MALQQAIQDCCVQMEKELTVAEASNIKESESLIHAYVDGASMLVGTCGGALRNFIQTNGKQPSGLDESSLADFAASAINCLLGLGNKLQGNMHLQVAYLDLLVKLCRICKAPGVPGDKDYPPLRVAIQVLSTIEVSSKIPPQERPVDWMRQRCYVASQLVELASNHGKHLVSHFPLVFYPNLWQELQNISSVYDSKSTGSFRADICLMCESLVLLGNHLSIDDRCVLIRNLISVVEVIFSECEPHFSTIVDYAAFIGLQGQQNNQSGSLTSINEYIHRQNNLRFSARLLAGILRRFSGDVASELHPLLQPLLPRYLNAIRVSMAIWAPDERTRVGIRPELMVIFDVSENDRKALLGTSPTCSWVRSAEPLDPDDTITVYGQNSNLTDPAIVQKFRNFVQCFAEYSFQLLAHFAKIFGALFYSTPNVGTELSAVLYTGLQKYPLPLLKTFIRSFLRPFVTNCPPASYNDAVVPMLRPFVLHINQILKERWNEVGESANSKQSEQTEIIETETTRQLTQEYMSFCCMLFLPINRPLVIRFLFT